MTWLIFVIIVIVILGVVIWISRRPPSDGRQEIHGQVCPKCGSKHVRWAGYADRKECAKCGKIFG